MLVGRDAGRAAVAVDELRRDTGNRAVEALTADVTRQADLHRLVGEVGDRYERLHVLINNAGVTRERRELTEDGVETAFAANVLAPFLLTHLLMAVLRASAPARVVNIAGGLPRGHIELDNLQGERSYAGLMFYNQTKLALMSMSYEFAQRHRPSGTGDPAVTVNVAYPGHAYTEMNKRLPTSAYPASVRPLVPLLRLAMPIVYGGRAVAKASRSSVRLASDPALAAVHGQYFDTNGRPAPWPPSTVDARNREAIWSLCARLGGLPVP